MGVFEKKFGGIFVADDRLYCCALQNLVVRVCCSHVFIVNVFIYS